MKASIITIVLSYIFVFVIGVALQDVIFPWGGAEESHLKPIYMGLIVLSGLIVGCTVYLAEVLKGNRGSLILEAPKLETGSMARSFRKRFDIA